MERHVETERLHSGGVVANSLQRETEGRSREIADAKVDQNRCQQCRVVQRNRVGDRIADDRRHGHASDAPVPGENGDLSKEIKDDHGDRERDHQEVNAVAARGDGATEKAEGSGDDDPDSSRRERVPTEVLSARGVNQVCHREAGDGIDPGLAERDHAAVAGQEDETRCGDPEPQRLGKDLCEREAVDDRGRTCQEQHQRADGHDLRDPDLPAGNAGDEWGGRAGSAQAGRPNRPSGRTASTATTSTKVSRIA